MVNESRGDSVQRLLDVREAQSTRNSRSRRPPWRLHVAAADLPDFWFYQTCKEFGFYQTCAPGSQCMFVQGLIDVDYLAGNCSKLYNVSINEIQQNIEET